MTTSKTGGKAGKAAGKAWSARFSAPLNKQVAQFNASVGFDKRLAFVDIAASIAHANMLASCGIIGKGEGRAIVRGLKRVGAEVAAGKFDWREEDEDVHFNIERRLIELTGDVGKKLHTARSRNDQVATDLRLYARGEADELLALLWQTQLALATRAQEHAATPMPGMTHLQVAQPVTLGHHLLAYEAMFARDGERLQDARRRLNLCPLGAGALAGAPYPINRAQVARALGFDGVCENSLDAVSDRDFAIELAAACALLMAHVSRLCEEIVLWNCPAFAFVDIADSFCTGSSMMPQKKNPDVPELMRGKFGRVAGAHTALLALIKSQPLAYNKDNQEDKEPLFDALQTAKSCVALLPPLLAALRFKPENMRRLLEQGYPTATELADALVKRGMPFKDAHAAVSVLVRRAQAAGKPLQQTTLAQAQQVAPLATAQTLSAMRVEEALRRRNHIGGTAPARVLAQAKKRVAALTKTAKKRGGKA